MKELPAKVDAALAAIRAVAETAKRNGIADFDRDRFQLYKALSVEDEASARHLHDALLARCEVLNEAQARIVSAGCATILAWINAWSEEGHHDDA